MKFPYFSQPDSMDCGITCLKMISNYYGKDYSIEYLRERCFAAKDGVSLLYISKTAEELGFKTIGGRINYEKLINEAPLPCILHWQQEHFVVLYKVNKRKKIFYISDPGKGLITYNIEEFKNAWLSTKSSNEEKGVALFFEPTAAFYNGKSETSKVKNLSFVLKYFVKYKKFFLTSNSNADKNR